MTMQENLSPTVFDVRDFGAAGDGVTDDTAVLQAAIDSAAAVQGIVFIPPGRYLTGPLYGAPKIRLTGAANFSFREPGGSVLVLKPGCEAKALLDITFAYGISIDNLCLVGDGIEAERLVHGIGIFKVDYGKQEDTPCIDHCRIERFSGDAIHLQRIWCFSVRHCSCCFCGGAGILVRGWDGFILDNWLSGNRGAGYAAYDENASVTLTGNRIEWNRSGGIVARGGAKYNITGNYIDRSGCAGMDIQGGSDFAVTGNVIYRSGKPEWTTDPATSAHLILRSVAGVSFCGNSLAVGRDDGGKGSYSPATGMVLDSLTDCVVANNVLHNGATENLVLEAGSMENCSIMNNMGSVYDIS